MTQHPWKNILYYVGLILFLLYVDPSTSILSKELRSIIPEQTSFFYTRPVIVVICWIFCVWGLGLLLNARSPWVRGLCWALFILTTLANGISMDLTESPFNVQQYDLILGEISHAPSYISTYFTYLLCAFFKYSGLLLLFFLYLALVRPPRYHQYKIIVLLAIVAAVVNLVRYKAVNNGTPSFYAIPGSMIYKHTSRTYFGPRNPVPVSPVLAPFIDNIIIIIDETVRDDFITLNNKDLPTTPYLATQDLVNYGTAMALANSSRHSNAAIRAGLTQEEMPDKTFQILKKPNLFQYAKTAGFTTHYANGQKKAASPVVDNLMNKFDLPHIDHFENVGEGSGQNICGDQPVADFIVRQVQSGGKNLIYVNKMGNHFPYANRYPKKEEIFTPAHLPGETQDNYEKTINAYKNAMRWSVDKFFAYLLPKLEGKNYLIIYASDHGEAISESGRTSGHCSLLTASPEEVRIAFFLKSDHKTLQNQFQALLPHKINKVSQYQIFPTTLRLLGYDPSWLKKEYGPSLLDPENQPLRFFIGSIQHSGHWGEFKLDSSHGETS